MKTKKPFLVITGASGFIGSGVVRYLNDQGINRLILVDDWKQSEKWKNLVGKDFVDLISKESLWQWLLGKEKEIQAFIHLGACSNTLEKDGNYLLENNYRFSVRLAQYAKEHGHRFIYASSAATYGKGEQGFSDEEEMLLQLRPITLYGYSKHLFDLWLQREKLLSRVVGLKYFNVFGPNENHKGMMASMIFKMAEKVQNQGKVELYRSSEPEKYKDGEQVRDFIYVKDVVKITCAFLQKPFDQIGGIFNVGRGKPTTWNELAKALFRAMKKKPQIEYVAMPPSMVKGYQNYTCAQMDKLHQIPKMSFHPMSIEEAVEDYVQQYLLKEARW